MVKQQIWTKQCQREVQRAKIYEEHDIIDSKRKIITQPKTIYVAQPCNNFMPDEFDVCDNCILDTYVSQLGFGHFDSCDSLSLDRMYSEEGVIAALRRARKDVIKERTS